MPELADPLVQFGLLGVMLMGFKSLINRILDQSFANQNIVTTQLVASLEKFSLAFEKLTETLDRNSTRDDARHAEAELRSQRRHADAEIAELRRHGDVLLAIEAAAKETRHDIRNTLTTHGILKDVE